MYKRVIVAVDGSTTSEHGLREALRLVKETGALVQAVFVIEDFIPFQVSQQDAETLEEDWDHSATLVLSQAARLAADQGLEIETRAIRTDAKRSIGEALTDYAKEWSADLIVMGTHGHRAIKQVFVGSVAESVIRTSDVPILLIREKNLNDG